MAGVDPAALCVEPLHPRQDEAVVPVHICRAGRVLAMRALAGRKEQDICKKTQGRLINAFGFAEMAVRALV